MTTNHRHNDDRSGHYDRRVTSVSPVPSVSSVPSAFRNKTSGSGQEGNNAG